ncbi:MAG: AraC family transcriptional regulator [Bacteroidia bacterium]
MNASFDTWTIIFLFAAIQGLFVSTVLLLKKDKHPSRKILAAIPFFFSVILIEYVLFWTNYQFYFPYLMSWYNCFVFLFGPFFYLYFKSVFTKNISKKDLLHFSVFVLCVVRLAPFLFRSMEWKQGFLLKQFTTDMSCFLGIAWLGIIHMIIYLIFIWKDFYALSLSGKEVKIWFRWLPGFFMSFIIAYASYFVLSRFSFFNPQWDYAISFSMMFFIYFLSWFGYMQPKVFSGFGVFEKDKEEVKYKNSPLKQDTGLAILQQLKALMDKDKLYLQSNISLDMVSSASGLSKHYISQAINENLQMNFFEYINILRITEARELLLKPKEELNIIEVAYQVGYNNKVSFNKAFKNITGQTPTEFRQSLEKR